MMIGIFVLLLQGCLGGIDTAEEDTSGDCDPADQQLCYVPHPWFVDSAEQGYCEQSGYVCGDAATLCPPGTMNLEKCEEVIGVAPDK